MRPGSGLKMSPSISRLKCNSPLDLSGNSKFGSRLTARLGLNRSTRSTLDLSVNSRSDFSGNSGLGLSGNSCLDSSVNSRLDLIGNTSRNSTDCTEYDWGEFFDFVWAEPRDSKMLHLWIQSK